MRASFQPLPFLTVVAQLASLLGEQGIMVLTAVHQSKDSALTKVSHCQIMRAMSSALDMVGSYCALSIDGPVHPHSLRIPDAD